MLGFKAPLAYSSSFYFICRKNGIERKYMMYEGEDVNTIDLLHETPTEGKNGVKVIVPVEYYDRNDFVSKIKEQLAYFESVYFDVDDVSNDSQIFRHEYFQISSMSQDNCLHICLDNVYYPIDFKKLGIEKINIPVGLRLSLTDGVFPTPNRESIRYTKEANQVILNKIRLVADYMVEKYNESVLETEDVLEVMNYYSYDSRNLTICDRSFDISRISHYSSKTIAQPRLKGVEVLNLETLFKNKDFIFGEYEVKYRIEGGRWRESKRSWDTQVKIKDVNKNNYFIFQDRISGNKKDYVKQKFGGGSRWSDKKFLIKKVKNFTLGRARASAHYDTYMDILNLRRIPKSEWRKAIQEFQGIIKMFINPLLNIDNLQIPQVWLDARKKAKVSISGGNGGVRKQKLKGEIVGKKANSLERWVGGKNCKWVSTTFNLENIHKTPCLMVYSDQSEKNIAFMDKLFKITRSLRNTKMEFVAFSDRELKNLEKINLHNWIKLSTFMEGNNKPFKRIITAYLIDRLYNQYEHVFDQRKCLQNISTDLYVKMSDLLDYKSDNFQHANDEVFKAMLEVAEDKNLFDYNIYSTYLSVKNVLEKLTFLKEIFQHVRWGRPSPEMETIISTLFKYYRFRIDWKRYNISLNDDVVLQELSEEDVEELV